MTDCHARQDIICNSHFYVRIFIAWLSCVFCASWLFTTFSVDFYFYKVPDIILIIFYFVLNFITLWTVCMAAAAAAAAGVRVTNGMLVAAAERFTHVAAHCVRAQFGCTALMEAARNGHADCARLLLDAGADKNAKDEVRASWFAATAGLARVFGCHG